jgi:hypothetical protein
MQSLWYTEQELEDQQFAKWKGRIWNQSKLELEGEHQYTDLQFTISTPAEQENNSNGLEERND